MERCGKPNKYYELNGMKGKSMKYVGGRLKLGFDLLGDGGFSPGNDVYSETLDIPENGDTPLDFLAYGLLRSGVELIRLDSANWLPIRHVLGKLPRPSKTGDESAVALEEKKEQVRKDLERCDHLRGMRMTSMEQGLVIKCVAMNSMVEHLDWSSNPMGPTDVMSMGWLLQETKSLEHVDLYKCQLNKTPELIRLSCETLTRSIVNSYRPQTIRFSGKGGFLPLQRLLGRGWNDPHDPAGTQFVSRSCLNPVTRELIMAAPTFVIDDVVVSNLMWLSTAHINAEEEEKEEEEEKKKKKKAQASNKHSEVVESTKLKSGDGEGEDDFGGSSEDDTVYVDNVNRTVENVAPRQLLYSSVDTANNIHIRPGQQLVDYAQRPLRQFEVAYISKLFSCV
jgi:hypothetical protein